MPTGHERRIFPEAVSISATLLLRLRATKSREPSGLRARPAGISRERPSALTVGRGMLWDGETVESGATLKTLMLPLTLER